MRILALFLILTACSSTNDLETRIVEGGPGQPITVGIAFVDNSNAIVDREGSRQYVVQVEVGNSIDTLLTVTQISIRTDGSGAFQVYPTVRKFNELIDPGKDHLFDVPVSGRLVRPWNFDLHEPHAVVLRVMVSLSNGDTYAYAFEGPVRDRP